MFIGGISLASETIGCCGCMGIVPCPGIAGGSGCAALSGGIGGEGGNGSVDGRKTPGGACIGGKMVTVTGEFPPNASGGDTKIWG
jgi:hypothetical protein